MSLKTYKALCIFTTFCNRGIILIGVFEIRPHLFKTEYFGLLIARKEDKYAKETYRIQLSSREHLKINFPHQVDSLIRLADSDSEWVLVASYTVTDPEAQLVYTLEKVTKSSNPTSPSLLKA